MYNGNDSNSQVTQKYGRNHTPVYNGNNRKISNQIKMAKSMHNLAQDTSQIENQKIKKPILKHSNSKYSQRKEDSTNRSLYTSSSYHEKSKIPVPKAVKKIIKNDNPTSKKPLKKRANNELKFHQENKEIFEYDTIEYHTHYNKYEDEPVEPLELVPTFMETNYDDTEDNSQQNLVVNLEDLVTEEYYIHHITQIMKLTNKITIYNLCREWWE